MDFEKASSELLDRLNQIRVENGLTELHQIPSRDLLLYAAKYEATLQSSPTDGNIEGSLNTIISSLIEICGSDDDDKKKIFMSAVATDVDIIVDITDNTLFASFSIFTYYLNIESVGLIIEGDVVVQGSLTQNFGPAYCLIEHAESEDDIFKEIGSVPPWQMILSPGDNEEENLMRFMIPVSVGNDLQSGVVKVSIFVDQLANVSYDDETVEGVDDISKYVLASVVVTSFAPPGELMASQADMSGLENIPADEEAGIDELKSSFSSPNRQNKLFEAEEQSELVVKEVRIACDYDDVMSMQSEGFELICVQFTPEGPLTEQDHLWKFHVMASYGPPSGTGVEDVMWVKCLKSLGTLPSLPLFETFHDYDLSLPDDDYSIYLAVKTGPNPHFKKLFMISSLMENEDCLTTWVGTMHGVYRPAPAEVGRVVGGPCGLYLMQDASIPVRDMRNAASPNVAASVPEPQRVGPAEPIGRAEELSEGENESDDEDDYDDEEELVAGLMQQLSELEAEKITLTNLNAELQKKAVVLMTKEKSLQGQSAAARTAADIASTAIEGPGVTAELNVEQNQEKEKQYQDTLQLIVDERNKLNKQLKEFDQLALDLQTRMDDKEFKANGIASSFKQFKKEILMKAENSRTGHTIPKNQIKQFESLEQKREEELEKVRLRNISLRTNFKKLERTLRAREQLAEGLHMIDFEQLKIENQTLNEKIEERNEELAKLKRKKTTTVQVLTHVREKLRFVEQANRVVRSELGTLESQISSFRNRVTSDKLERDSIRGENQELCAKQGFASSDLLLIDYERRKNKVEQLKAAIAELKDRYNIMARQLHKTQHPGSSGVLRSASLTPWGVSSESKTK